MKKAKRFLVAAGLALLLPGVAGAADFGPMGDSFWGGLFGQVWEGLTGVWTAGGSIDPNGMDGADAGGSIDPNGGLNGACVGDCGPSIDPNG